MKLGIYVGSFDPVHKAHIEVVNHLIENNYVDKVIMIATNEYWDKQELTDIKIRIDMLKFYESNKLIIDTNLNSTSYTYEILNNLQKQYPGDELYLIIGADNIEQFHLWKKVEEILKNKILVLPRNDINISKYIEQFHQKEQFLIVKNFIPYFISSTKIREKIKNKDYEGIDELLDKNVFEYILKNDVYR